MRMSSIWLGREAWGIAAVAGVIEPQTVYPSPLAIAALFAVLLLPHVLAGLVAGSLVSLVPPRRRIKSSSWVGLGWVEFGCGVLGLLLNFGVMFALRAVRPEAAPSFGDLGVVHLATMAVGGVLAVFVVRCFVRRR